jgi:hypothetical protein
MRRASMQRQAANPTDRPFNQRTQTADTPRCLPLMPLAITPAHTLLSLMLIAPIDTAFRARHYFEPPLSARCHFHHLRHYFRHYSLLFIFFHFVPFSLSLMLIYYAAVRYAPRHYCLSILLVIFRY